MAWWWTASIHYTSATVKSLSSIIAQTMWMYHNYLMLNTNDCLCLSMNFVGCFRTCRQWLPHGPLFYFIDSGHLGRVTANARRPCICNVFSHWLRSFPHAMRRELENGPWFIMQVRSLSPTTVLTNNVWHLAKIQLSENIKKVVLNIVWYLAKIKIVN